MVSDEALKKLQEQIAAWPMERRFVVQQLIRDYLRNREDLRAYEATRLTPRGVEILKEEKLSSDGMILLGRLMGKKLHKIGCDRLRELAEADKDGRLVVLPCKVGDTVYLIVTKRARNYTPEFRFVKKSRLTFLNMERILQDFGKEAFLTREEAEKTLEAMK